MNNATASAIRSTCANCGDAASIGTIGDGTPYCAPCARADVRYANLHGFLQEAMQDAWAEGIRGADGFATWYVVTLEGGQYDRTIALVMADEARTYWHTFAAAIPLPLSCGCESEDACDCEGDYRTSMHERTEGLSWQEACDALASGAIVLVAMHNATCEPERCRIVALAASDKTSASVESEDERFHGTYGLASMAPMA